MRNIASRFTSVRLIGLTTLATAGGVLALATSAPAAAAAATVSAPTLSVSFTPAEIGVTDSTGIAYTITNPNSSGSLYNVSFTDTLPSFATIDDPTGLASSGCGAPSIGAGAGDNAAGANSITVKAGTPCVITLSVVGNSPGVGSDSLSPLTYQPSLTTPVKTAPSGNATTASLTVLAPPTATITTPKRGAKYTYGEKVKAIFACTAPNDANGPTLSGCLASDDLGNTITSGGDIDTTDPGVHTITVEAQDTDTDTANATATYTVLPDNIDAIKTVTAAKNGGVKLGLKLPGAGTVKVTETHGATTFASKTVTVGKAYAALSVPLIPTPAGKKLLTTTTVKNGKKVTTATKVKVILVVTYTPKGGSAHRLTRVLTLG